MFKAVKETDKLGKAQTHFYLTQGDSLTIYATPYKNGEKLALESIEKCLFKLSSSDYIEEFQVECEPSDEKFILRLSSEETSSFEIGSHIYEFEYTLVGGEVYTPNQWKFEILYQIIK